MKTYWLACHEDSPQSALNGIRVDISRRNERTLFAEFRALGDMSKVEWPGDQLLGHENWARANELWQHSCFELFVRKPIGPEYAEVNLATNARWAAYGFHSYRNGMCPVEDLTLVKAVWRIQPRRVQLWARLELPEEFRDGDWHLGLSAVIEETRGTKSYWALAHPPGKPDFHHPTCFAATLPPPEIT